MRTGMRAGELLALQWGDIDWRGRYILVQRNLVRGTLTTPKNHQCRRVDLSPQLRAVVRHTFASLLLQAGEPITYVSRQLRHKDSAITLRVYAQWLPESTGRKGVDRLDENPAVAQPLHKPARRARREAA
jgi:integrase